MCFLSSSIIFLNEIHLLILQGKNCTLVDEPDFYYYVKAIGTDMILLYVDLGNLGFEKLITWTLGFTGYFSV